MKAKDLMTRELVSVETDANIAQAAWLMWRHDCGVLPVLERGALVGVVTDRDLCMAASTKPRPAFDIRVREVLEGRTDPLVLHTEDQVHFALELMAGAKVRRLPVVDEEGRLCGIVSINDILRVADAKKDRGRPSSDEVVDALKQIGRRGTDAKEHALASSAEEA
jgi:CBS domain-containing protein